MLDETVVKTLIEQKTLSPLEVALISAGVSFLAFIVASIFKNYFASKLHRRKLETEHILEQRKQIKSVLAKNKVQLLSACEELNFRFWNFARRHNEGWLKMNGNYGEEDYFFHSFCYRILAVFAWIKIIHKEMIFLDTTIATQKDLEFIKFLRVFPEVFIDLSHLNGEKPQGNKDTDHFYKNKFEQFSDTIISENRVLSYSEFIARLGDHQTELSEL